MAREKSSDVVDLLRRQPAFAECDNRDLADLAKHGNRTSVPAHWSVIQQQTPADACYVILEGEATVSVGGTQVATLGPGAVVGEAGLIGRKLRNATVTSTTPLQLLHIEADDFASLLARRPKLATALDARTRPAEQAAESAD